MSNLGKESVLNKEVANEAKNLVSNVLLSTMTKSDQKIVRKNQKN